MLQTPCSAAPRAFPASCLGLRIDGRVVCNPGFPWQPLPVTKVAAASLGPSSKHCSSAKTAVVTGGTRGIGLAISHALAADGYNLVLGYNSNTDAAHKAKDALQGQHGIKVETVKGDVAKRSTMEALFACAASSFGQCMAFVHNAGLLQGISSFSEMEEAPSFETMMQTGLDVKPADIDLDAIETTFTYYWKIYTLAFALGLQLARQVTGLRHVVAISAPGCNTLQTPRVIFQDRGQGKAGMEHLVRCAARTYMKDGININTVIPGRVLVGGMIWEMTTEAGQKVQAQRLEQGVRYIDPDEIAQVVAFLCSPRGAAISGTSIHVDGGLHLV